MSHKLIVREVGESEEPFHLGDFADYEIVHDDDCQQDEYGMWTCSVGWQADQGDVRWSLKYAGTPVTEPGEYLIDFWSETYRGFDYTEHDAGLHIVAESALGDRKEPAQ